MSPFHPKHEESIRIIPTRLLVARAAANWVRNYLDGQSQIRASTQSIKSQLRKLTEAMRIRLKQGREKRQK